jgi:hypothetical protein
MLSGVMKLAPERAMINKSILIEISGVETLGIVMGVLRKL